MGYWEQIGEDNIRYRKRRARMHPLKRKAIDLGIGCLIVAFFVAYWAPFFLPFLIGW